jgi:predicted house-cleaning noncanonical NTP pyrophosphatase (MazG superfamily)
MNKLVRDRIPERIREGGGRPKTRRLEAHERLSALLEKLEEETRELRATPNLEEAADVLEVLLSIAQELETDEAQLTTVRLEKRATHGGFELGYVLEIGG